MTNGWPMVPLGEVLKLQRRWLKPDPFTDYGEIGVRSFGKGIFHKAPVSGASLGDKRVLRIEPGDLVFMNVFAWEGAVAIAGPDVAGKIGSHRFATYTPVEGKVDVRFLNQYFKTHDGRELLGRVSPGSALRNRTMNLALFAEQKVPLPPLAEQRRIVARIECLAAKIAEAAVLRRKSDDTVDTHGKRVAAALVRGINFPKKPLGELVKIRGGGTPSKANPLYWEGNIPWVSPKDMKVPDLFDAEDHISKDATEQSSAKLLDAGSVLVVIRGMILAHTFPVAILRVPATINQDMKALVPCGEMTGEYLAAVLRALHHDVLSLVDRSTHDTRKLLTEKLMSFAIPFPPLAEQRRIVAHLDALTDKTAALKQLQSQSAAEIDALLPSILDREFDGGLVE